MADTMKLTIEVEFRHILTIQGELDVRGYVQDFAENLRYHDGMVVSAKLTKVEDMARG